MTQEMCTWNVLGGISERNKFRLGNKNKMWSVVASIKQTRGAETTMAETITEGRMEAMAREWKGSHILPFDPSSSLHMPRMNF